MTTLTLEGMTVVLDPHHMPWTKNALQNNHAVACSFSRLYYCISSKTKVRFSFRFTFLWFGLLGLHF